MSGPWEDFKKQDSGPWEEFAPKKPVAEQKQQNQRPSFLQNMAMVLTSPQLAGGPLAAAGREGIQRVDEFVDKGAVAGGAAATDVLSGVGLPPELAAAGGTATNFGIRAVPTVLGYTAGKVAEVATKPAGRAIMQSALKPSSKDIASGDAAKGIETMLQKGYNVTPGGVSDMRKRVKALSQQVEDMIQSSNVAIDEKVVLREVAEKLREFRFQARPMSDLKTIRNAWKEFTDTWNQKMPVELAHRIKQGTYKVLADKYAHLGTVGDEAATQADMAIARGLRKATEKAVPGVNVPNKEMSDLINAIELAERRAGIAANRDIAGIAWLAEHPAAAGGMLADRSPWLKSLLARYLYSGMPATGALAANASEVQPVLADTYGLLMGGPQP